MVEYLWSVFCYAFSGAWAIANSVAFIVAILGGIIAWKYPPKEVIMQKLAWIIPLVIFCVVLIISLAIVAPYNIYKNQKQKINELQNNLAVQNAKTDTKQDIRNFLESVRPVILQMVDARQKEIYVFIGALKQMKLSDLSERPDFSKFLSFKKSGAHCIGDTPENGLIKELGYNGYMDGYYFYPKDALIK